MSNYYRESKEKSSKFESRGGLFKSLNIGSNGEKLNYLYSLDYSRDVLNLKIIKEN